LGVTVESPPEEGDGVRESVTVAEEEGEPPLPAPPPAPLVELASEVTVVALEGLALTLVPPEALVQVVEVGEEDVEAAPGTGLGVFAPTPLGVTAELLEGKAAVTVAWALVEPRALRVARVALGDPEPGA